MATIPPISAAWMLAGSGPMRRPCGASAALTHAPTAPGWQATSAAAGVHADGAQVARDHDQDAIADRLPREAGAAGAEAHRGAVARRHQHGRAHVVGVARQHHHARHQPVDAGVARPLQAFGEVPARHARRGRRDQVVDQAVARGAAHALGARCGSERLQGHARHRGHGLRTGERRGDGTRVRRHGPAGVVLGELQAGDDARRGRAWSARGRSAPAGAGCGPRPGRWRAGRAARCGRGRSPPPARGASRRAGRGRRPPAVRGCRRRGARSRGRAPRAASAGRRPGGRRCSAPPRSSPPGWRARRRRARRPSRRGCRWCR